MRLSALLKKQDWIIAEVLRRGVEAILRAYPAHKQKKTSSWKLPAPLKTKLLVQDPTRLKEIFFEDAYS